jgi:sulfatase maturation enzyme AslB (radical SAM superfamily)
LNGKKFFLAMSKTILRQGERELAISHVDKIPGCKDCKWRYICGGGCAFQTKYNFGTFQHTSPYCGVYKAILPVVVELHALQLIREFQKKGGGENGISGHITSGQ